MKFGVTMPAFDQYADPHKLAALARTAEQAGWDGFFIWDHVLFDDFFYPIADPWVALAAVALNTTRVKIGALVTPLARRRPWQVARQTVTLDHLSGGRLIFGAGLGGNDDWDFGAFGEQEAAPARASMLDEGLTILDGLWSGQPFQFAGSHYQLREMIFNPPPLQKPRIPVWVGGSWDKAAPARRAARWDGYMPLKWLDMLTPDEWRDVMARVNANRADTNIPYDWIHMGISPADAALAGDLARPYAEMGISWWIETASPWEYGWKFEDRLTPAAWEPIEARIASGPPEL